MGPWCSEAPPKALGTLDDFWFRWITDFSAPGPDRGLGGKYLILSPGYNGPLPGVVTLSPAPGPPASCSWVARSWRTNDPKPTADLIKSATKIYPYEPGGLGTSIAEFLSGKAKLTEPPPMR